jgi:hypothetical protein
LQGGSRTEENTSCSPYISKTLRMGDFRWWPAVKAPGGGEALPALGYHGGAGERGRQRGESEEDLGEVAAAALVAHLEWKFVSFFF